MIHQHLYWPYIRYVVPKEVTNYETCQRAKTPKKEYGKLKAKVAEKIPRNKLCVNLIRPYVIQRRGGGGLYLKAVTRIDPVTGWFEVVRYDDKIAITIADLVETTWMSKYPRPI